MLPDLLVHFPADLIERTSSTVRVQQVLQLSLAPAFLLAGIGAIMNVMTNRLIWVANRIERIRELETEDRAGRSVEDLPALEKRRTLAQTAVMFSTASALVIAIDIAVLFVSAFVTPQIGSLSALFFVLAMILLSIGLTLFVQETRTAARRNRERLRQERSENRTRGG